MASPSCRTCEVRTNRSRMRIARATSARPTVSVVSIAVISGGAALGVLLVQLFQDLLDPVLVAHGLVEAELQLGYAAQPHAAPDLTPQEGYGAVEPFGGLLPRLVVTQAGVEHARQLQVGRDLDARQRDEADPRIVDRPPAEQVAQH